MKRFLILILLLFATHSYAAVYHIDPTVGTSGTGTASSPFKSWANLPAMATGDDVYFKCGTTMIPTSYMSISWEGTAENRVIIGSYYLSGSTAIYGVSGNRPIISGNNWLIPDNYFFGTTHTHVYRGVFDIRSKDYITIENIHIYRSGASGIWIAGDLTAGTNSAYFIIDNVKIEEAADYGIAIANNQYNYGVIKNCDVSRCAYGWKYAVEDTGENFDIWPVIVVVSGCANANTTIQDNYIHENWGEGIGGFNKSTHILIKNNIVWNNRRVCIYFDGIEDSEAYGNLLLGAGASTVGPYSSITAEGRNWNQMGIWLNAEIYPNTTTLAMSNNKIHNNIIAGLYTGIGIATEIGGTVENIEVSNNTLIANKQNISISQYIDQCTTTNFNIRNNISFCPSDAISNNYKTDYSWMEDKISFSNNAWTGAIPTYIGSPSDILINTNFAKTSGWQNLSGPIDAVNAKLLSGSTAIEAGATIASLLTDYFGNTRTAPYDIGAHEYSATTGPEPPDPPSDSSCVKGTPTTDWAQTTYNSTQGQSTWPRGVSGEVGVTGNLYGLKLSVASYTDPESTLTIRYKKNSNDLSTGATEQVVSITATGLLDIGLTTPLAVTTGDTLYVGWAETAGAIVLNVNSASVTADLAAVYGNGSGDWVLDQVEAKEHYIQTLICVPIESPSSACDTVTDIQTTAYTTNTNTLDSTPRGQTVTLEPAYYKSMSLQLTATGAGSLTGRIGAEGTVDLSSGYLDEVVVAVPITASMTRYKFEFSEPLWLDGQYAIGFIATSGTIVRYKADGDVYSGGNGIFGSGAGQWNMTGTSPMDWNVIFEKCETGKTRRSRPGAILLGW